MAANAIDHLDNINTKASDKVADSSHDKETFNAGDLWMNLSLAAGKDSKPHAVSGLPKVDLQSSAENDHGSNNPANDNFLDDIDTVLRNIDTSKLHVITEQPAKLSTEPSKDSLPVINCKDMTAGQIGLLASKNSDGNTYYTPFVAGVGDNTALTTNPIKLNEDAAKNLHVEDALKNGQSVKVDLIALPADSNGGFSPHNPSELNQVVQDKIHDMAEDVRNKQAEDGAKDRAAAPSAPVPDKDFGYRRTERSAEELTKIADNYRALAREYQKDALDPNGLDDRIKAFAQGAQDDITKYQKEVNQHQKEFDVIAHKENALKAQEHRLGHGKKTAHQREALEEQIKALDVTAKQSGAVLQTSQYNLSYAQSELNISKDKGAYVRHMEARASAAATLSYNPDMDGALTGHRIVVNSGHFPGDKQFPGFFKDDTAEWKLNMESEDVLGSMIKMTGGAVKLVNQIDLKSRGMTGLANAIHDAHPEAAIAIHHDDDSPADSPNMRGTLTLECAKSTGKWSMDLAQVTHAAKLNYAGLDDRVNAKGDSIGIREQCGRGIQGHNVGAPFILDEQLSTHKDEWPLARNPKVNAEIQFAHIASLYEFFNNKPHYKYDPADAKAWKDTIWSKTDMDDVWTNRPKVGAW